MPGGRITLRHAVSRAGRAAQSDVDMVLMVGLMLEAAEHLRVRCKVSGGASITAESILKFRVDEDALNIAVAMEGLHQFPISFYVEVW